MNGNEWKKSLWDFFAAGIGFWILKTDTSRTEKTILGVITLMMVVLTVFM